MKTRVIVLAAGKSKRMNGVTKTLLPIGNQPMINRLLAAVAASGVDDRPVIVVGQNADEMKSVLGETYDYVIQTEQLGTGHAVRSTEEFLKNKADAVVVFYGDMPFVRKETIQNLVRTHEHDGAVITMITARVPDFEDWRKTFFDFGRIARGSDGTIKAIIEKRDATPEELEIREINPGFFCFNAEWLWKNLEQLKSHNAQNEYYLTDLVGMAMNQHEKIVTIEGDYQEIVGVNTPEQLELARKLAG